MSGQVAPRENYKAFVEQIFAGQPLMHHLGIELLKVEPGYVELGAAFKKHLSQNHGFFHGGMVGALADACGGFAGNSIAPEGKVTLTVEYKLNIITPAIGDYIKAKAKVIRGGKSLVHVQVDVFTYLGSRNSRNRNSGDKYLGDKSADSKESHCASALMTLMHVDQ